MAQTTESIPPIDFKGRPEWLPQIAPYSLYHRKRDIAGIVLSCDAEAVHAATFSTAFIKTSFEGELLSNIPSRLMSFLNIRWQYLQEGDTYKTIIDQHDIDILSSLIKNQTASHSVVVPLSRDAEAFCSNQGIREYVNVASDLLNQCFFNMQSVNSEVLQDPDTDDQLLVIHVKVKGEINEVLDMYDKYIAEWVLRVPWPERAKISLSYITI